MTRVAIAATIAVAVAASPAAAAPARPQPTAPPEAGAYFEELERRGLVDKSLATPAALKEAVHAAEEELLAGRPDAAAERLYAIVEAPQFAYLDDSEDFQDAEYRLGVALGRGGAPLTARTYLERALKRGFTAPLFEPALRAYVDLCLIDRTPVGCVQQLDLLGITDLNGEVTYLRGRAAYDDGHLDDAEEELKRVSPRSRFYTAALYLRGVAAVRRGDFQAGSDAFCAIADVKDDDTLRFYIDGRYYALRDLARLALGRVAHEEGRYDDAFYHYFLVPEDSERLGEALFEAAWSSLQRHDYHLGARLIDEFLRKQPRSPRGLEAVLLRATLEVKTCRFGAAEQHFDAFLAAYEPLDKALDRAAVDAALAQSLARRLLLRTRNQATTPPPGSAEEVEARLADLLRLQPGYLRLEDLRRGLERESLDAAHVEDAWRTLENKVRQEGVAPTLAPAGAAAELLEQLRDLGGAVTTARADALQAAPTQNRAGTFERWASYESSDELKHLKAIETRRAELVGRVLALARAEAKQASELPTQSAKGLLPLARLEVSAAAVRRLHAAELLARLDEASGRLLAESLVELRGQLGDLLRRARLGKIDAVVGRKRRLEREIENLAAGRFPPELFGKLHIEGLIGDDEEYWPPEPEQWADEYENFR